MKTFTWLHTEWPRAYSSLKNMKTSKLDQIQSLQPPVLFLMCLQAILEPHVERGNYKMSLLGTLPVCKGSILKEFYSRKFCLEHWDHHPWIDMSSTTAFNYKPQITLLF